MIPLTPAASAAAEAAVKVAAGLGVYCHDPVVLADGANVVVHLSPAPVVAKVAASTTAVRPDPAAWLQRGAFLRWLNSVLGASSVRGTGGDLAVAW